MADVFGVLNLKKLIKFACDFTRQVATALEDGKFQLMEATGFFDEILQIPGVVKSFPAIKDELKDLSPEERQELYDYLAVEFDIPNDRVEVFVENSILFTISAVVLFEQWKALKNPPTPIV